MLLRPSLEKTRLRWQGDLEDSMMSGGGSEHQEGSCAGISKDWTHFFLELALQKDALQMKMLSTFGVVPSLPA